MPIIESAARLQSRITSSCGCFTDRHDRVQHKCPGHAGNPIAAGYTAA